VLWANGFTVVNELGVKGLTVVGGTNETPVWPIGLEVVFGMTKNLFDRIEEDP